MAMSEGFGGAYWYTAHCKKRPQKR
jgi:hypothetical protein